jgi:hypothetical protein
MTERECYERVKSDLDGTMLEFFRCELARLITFRKSLTPIIEGAVEEGRSGMVRDYMTVVGIILDKCEKLVADVQKMQHRDGVFRDVSVVAIDVDTATEYGDHYERKRTP